MNGNKVFEVVNWTASEYSNVKVEEITTSVSFELVSFDWSKHWKSCAIMTWSNVPKTPLRDLSRNECILDNMFSSTLQGFQTPYP